MDAAARRTRLIRHLVAGAVVLVLGASLSGCFSVLHAAQRAVAPDDMRSVTDVPPPVVVATVRPEQPLVTIAPGMTVATGVIRSSARAYYGRVAVVSTVKGGYDLTVSDVRVPDGHPLVAALASTEVAADATCDRPPATDGSLPALGPVDPHRSTTFALSTASGQFWRDDPTFLSNVLLLDPLKNSPGCLSAIAANAPINWTLPDMNPGFRIIDTGETGGARGGIHGTFDQLTSYTVAQGDVLPEIAARFSISLEDLEWLNPVRFQGQQAEFGETLNLARYLR